jgi:hypothetical protein
MREHFVLDWMSAAEGAVQKVVEERFPEDAHRWPLLRAFNFEGYRCKDRFLVLILRDKASGIPAGSGTVQSWDDSDAPSDAPSSESLELWQQYVRKKFNVRNQDLAIILPITEGGQNVEDDWAQWSESDKVLWYRQLDYSITLQFYRLKGFDVRGDFLIPPGYLFLADNCRAFFEDHPSYEKNVFIMTRVLPGNRLLEELDRELREVLRRHGLNPNAGQLAALRG